MDLFITQNHGLWEQNMGRWNLKNNPFRLNLILPRVKSCCEAIPTLNIDHRYLRSEMLSSPWHLHIFPLHAYIFGTMTGVAVISLTSSRRAGGRARYEREREGREAAVWSESRWVTLLWTERSTQKAADASGVSVITLRWFSHSPSRTRESEMELKVDGGCILRRRRMREGGGGRGREEGDGDGMEDNLGWDDNGKGEDLLYLSSCLSPIVNS